MDAMFRVLVLHWLFRAVPGCVFGVFGHCFGSTDTESVDQQAFSREKEFAKFL